MSPGKLPAVGPLLALLAVLTVACGAEATEAPLPAATAIPDETLTSTPPSSLTADVPTITPAPTATPASTATLVPTATPAPVATFVPIPTPVPTPTAAPTPAPAPPGPAEIYARVSPSVAFIETPTGTGSGVLIPGGYIVTNAHVIWPFHQARVVFPDGSEFKDAPVANWDYMADLAVIGPLDTGIEPMLLADGEDIPIGSDMFLIGYPGEDESFPQPTITGGILSRLREWDPIGFTYFQTDATAVSGQSGGVLVSGDGQVIGISGFSIGEAQFGLVASAADVLPRVERLIAGEDGSGLGKRLVPADGGSLDHGMKLRNFWDTRMFVVNQPVGTDINFTLEGSNDGILFFLDTLGNLVLELDREFTGIESGSANLEFVGPYFVTIGQLSETPGDFRLSSNHPLAAFIDPDDGTSITVGQTITASIDYPFDLDDFLIVLSEGETVEITMDSLNVDSFIRVDYIGARDDQVASDDDSGRGIFGFNAKLVYQAPHSGAFFIVASDASGLAVGGYLLSVKAPGGPAGISP